MSATINDSELAELTKTLESAQREDIETAPTVLPADTSVVLPVGLWDPFVGLRDTAEVRELTGFDEEHIAKAKTLGAAMQTVLERAVVRIGDRAPEKGDLDALTVGDRLELMIAIRRVTWGATAEVTDYCGECADMVTVEVSLDDIERVELGDKMDDRTFEVALPSGKTAKLEYPSGKIHRLVLGVEELTGAEMTTALIADCVKDLTGVPFIDEKVAKSLPMRDRRAISDSLVDKIPGPKLDGITTECPECSTEMTVSIPVGALFPG